MKVKVLERIAVLGDFLEVDDVYESDEATLSWYVDQGYAEVLEAEKPKTKTATKAKKG